MGNQITDFQDTPNPNALKCVLATPLPERNDATAPLRSYQSREAAAGDALADALFNVPGVVGVLVHSGWITVTREPGVDWKQIKAGVMRVVGGAE